MAILIVSLLERVVENHIRKPSSRIESSKQFVEAVVELRHFELRKSTCRHSVEIREDMLSLELAS